MAHPFGAGTSPRSARVAYRSDAESVQSASVDVQLGWYIGAAQRQIHDDAMLGRADRIGATVRQKDGGRAGRHAEAGRQPVVLLRLQIARIDRNSEIRPAAHLVDVIDRLIGPLVEARRSGDCEMASRRKSDDAGAVGIDAPLFGLTAHQADGALRILERAPGWLFTWDVI